MAVYLIGYDIGISSSKAAPLDSGAVVVAASAILQKKEGAIIAYHSGDANMFLGPFFDEASVGLKATRIIEPDGRIASAYQQAYKQWQTVLETQILASDANAK